ncbi:MAG: phosphatidylserine/phosphatidylglycerophosphate/cardiolipin synthase family protein [Xanthomonadaceae bacterium]|nr:phosphatidylserine/phosphatidylglycerophosphate/cardiolipin synthase family protein [Xanthomonadaceae bacterium]
MILLLLTLLTTTPTFAKEYIFTGDQNVVAIPLEDSLDDFALRVEAIKRAKVSIDVFTYMQTLDDKLGEEYIQALEDAIRRGVKVRYAMDWLPNTAALGRKARAPAERLLREAYTSESCSLEVQCITPFSKIMAGYTPTDNFHEKILNIDMGTEDEIAWVSGRNNNDFAVRDLDFAVVLRRVNKKKNSAISLLGKVFEDHWKETLEMQDPEVKSAGIATKRKKPKEPLLLGTTKLYPGLKECLFSGSEIQGVTFKPHTMSVTTNSFFEQLKKNSWFTWIRDDKMKSDNIDTVVRGIQRAKVIRMSLMSTFWPAPLKEALLNAVSRGVKIEIFTNSSETDKVAVPGGLAYLYSSRDLSDLMKKVNTYNNGDCEVKTELKINVLNAKKIQEDASGFWKRIKFIHQKMIITDQEIFMGSDNYNQASMVKNSEMQVRFTGKDALSFFHCHFDEISKLFTPLTENEIMKAKQESLGPLNRIMIRALKPFF